MNKLQKVLIFIVDSGLSMLNSLKLRLSKENKSESETEKTIEDLQFNLVPTPIQPGKENYQCVSDIEKKLKDKKIKNIALTGSFGSGKSSILETLQEEFKGYHYLKISLATFKIEHENLEDEKKNPEKKSGNIIPEKKTDFFESEERINRLLEYCILQQIIYHEKINKIPESRFRRIKHVTNLSSIKASGIIVSFLLSLAILFEPAFLNISSLHNLFSFISPYKSWIDYSCLAIVIYDIFYGIKNLYQISQNSKLNKINLKEGVIEIDNQNNSSILNKHLDEIIYFFEATKYNVVIIEDLDRFETSNIFTKLREINFLINNSKAINRHVVFIYAIRDDIFKDNLRTKFFDYIVSVIPIINPTNAGDKLIQYLNARKVTGITDRQCKELGIFIDDLRLLKNIVNEFMQYKSKLNPNLSMYKLLAIIIYKNYYPQDFVDLHNMKGLVYTAFQNKTKYAQKSIENVNERIKILEDEIQNIEKQKYTSLSELRTFYILKYLKYLPNMVCFAAGKLDFSFEDLQKEDNFNKLISGEINNLKYLQSNTYNYSAISPNFKAIEKEVDEYNSYAERVELWNKKENNEIILLKRNIQTFINLKFEIQSYPLKDILSNENNLISTLYTDLSENKLLVFLLQSGYIDDNYNDYISFFHPGSITNSDNDFLINLKIGKSSGFSYSLNKIELLLNEIPIGLFKKSIILNISLLDHLLGKEQIIDPKIFHIIKLIKKKDKVAFDFSFEYLNKGKQSQLFIKILANQWEELWTSIEESEYISPENKEYYLYRILKEANIDDLSKQNINDKLSSHLNNNYSLLATWQENIGLERLIEILEKLKLSFGKLSMASEPNGLLQYTVSVNRYGINIDNIKIILLHDSQSSLLINSFKTASYTAILESGNESLIEYVQTNLEYCIENIFSLSGNSIYESELALIDISGAFEISKEIRKGYLSKQKNKIVDIKSINNEYWEKDEIPSNWDLGLESNIVQSTWENVLTYYKTHEYSVTLIEFLSKESNFSDLGKTSLLSLQEEDDEYISKISESILTTDKFTQDCFENLRNGLDIKFVAVDFSSLSKDKVSVLIKTEVLILNEFNLEALRTKYSGYQCNLIIQYKQEYLKSINNFILLTGELLYLLDSDSFTLKEKFKIIKTLTPQILNKNAQLSTKICQILNNHISSNDIDYDLFKDIIHYCSDNDLKISLVTEYLTKYNFDIKTTTDLLSLLPADYYALTLKLKRPKFKNNNVNRTLLEFLKSKNYIHKCDIDGNKIKVTSRTK
ncbi:MAG TPA: hypothetical protein VIK55_01810 [Paludibacter sp.]